MFVVFEDGNRQYRVKEGDTLNVDFREGAKKGDAVSFERVLLASAAADKNSIGAPVLDGAVVQAEVVLPEFKGEKIDIQKFRRRKHYRRHTGHRQKYTTVRIKSIRVPGL